VRRRTLLSDNGQSIKEDLRRKLKKLKKRGDVAITLNHSLPDCHPLLERFIALQKKRCAQTSFSSPFAHSPLKEFWHALIERFQDSGVLRFATLRLNGEVIAVNCHFIASARMSLYLTTFDSAYHAYSPAMLLLDEIIRSWQATAMPEVYDFGRGEEEYKHRFADASALYSEFIAAPHFPAYVAAHVAWFHIKRRLKKIKVLVAYVRQLKKIWQQI